MRKHLRYASYVARHKWWVFVAGIKTDAPIWRLFIHDWSKLTLAEWGPYVHQFYGPKPKRKQEFQAAWLHHQHRNPHHWQHWILRRDDGRIECLPMPENFVREMVADWMGAGRAIRGRWEIAEWWAKNEETIELHKETRALVEYLVEMATR